MSKDLQYYANLFSQVTRGRNTHSNQQELSPYKPIFFLLAVIELIDKSYILDNKITTSRSDYISLKKIFKNYQNILGGSYKNKQHTFCQPFFNLVNDKHPDTGEKFWHLEPNSGSPKIEDIRDAEGRNRIKTEAKLKELIAYGKFDKELWELLQDPESRIFLINVIMETFFLGINYEEVEEIINTLNEEVEKPSILVLEPKISERKYTSKKSLLRNSLFSNSVTYIYQYQCAVCRLQVKARGLRYHKNIVEAAHIIPFSLSNDNRLSNGISLCRNHHWEFDNGCFGIDDKEYSIIVSDNCNEECLTPVKNLNTVPLRKYHGHQIFLPKEEKYYPSREALAWHRNKHCLG
jgi:putative restriction endonuclease